MDEFDETDEGYKFFLDIGLFCLSQMLVAQRPKIEKALYKKTNRATFLERLHDLSTEAMYMAGRMDGGDSVLDDVRDIDAEFKEKHYKALLSNWHALRKYTERKQLDSILKFFLDLHQEIGQEAFFALWRGRGAPKKVYGVALEKLTKRERAYREIISNCVWPQIGAQKATPLSGARKFIREYQAAGLLVASQEETDLRNIKRLYKRLVDADEFIDAPNQSPIATQFSISDPAKTLGIRARDVADIFRKRDKN